MSGRFTLFSGEAAADSTGFEARPGAVLLELGGGLPRLLASGRTGEVERHPAAAGATRRALPRSVLLPALVNAHCHLDLTAIGPRPYDPAGGFTGWVDMIRAERRADGHDPAGAVREGVRRSLAGGVVAVGDIAGAMRAEAHEALRESSLMGVSFVEFFGAGARQAGAIAAMEALVERERRDRSPADAGPARVRLGLQPHATYSAGLALYRAAGRLQRRFGVPLATHLAETIDELEFIARGTGPMQDLIRRVGAWDDSVLDDLGRGKRPVTHLIGPLTASVFLAAHVNAINDEEIEALARTRTSVVFCPRAWEYFGHGRTLGPHRWRDMLEAGINVALGTDSIINLPPEESGRISPLDDARRLHTRERADPRVLLGMATTNGARALGLDPAWFTLAPPGGTEGRPIAGLIAVDAGEGAAGASALEAVMRSSAPAVLLAGVPPR